MKKIPIIIYIIFLSISEDHVNCHLHHLHRRHNNSKSIIGSSLYTLTIEMDSFQILDFIIDNAYGKKTYIKDHFNIPRPEIKISSMQRMLENSELSQLDKALEDLNIEYDNFKTVYLSYHPTYRLITLLGISVGSSVDRFLNFLDNNSETLFQILKLVNIDPAQFQETVQTKTEEEFFQLLADGNYDQPNVQQALELANVTVTMTNIVNTLGLTKDFVTNFVLNVAGSFTGLMRQLQVASDNLKLSLRNFKEIESSKEPRVMTPMPTLFEGLEELKSVSIQISQYKTVTHKDAEVLKTLRELAPNAKLIGTNVFDSRKVVMIPNTLNPTLANYATLWTEDSMGTDFIALAMTDEIEAKKKYDECSYWFVENGFARRVVTVPTLYQKHFLVKKEEADKVLFDGTPLVCYGKLYAVTVDDSFGKDEVEFFSKYPIMERQEKTDEGFFGSILNFFKRIIRGIWDFALAPFRYLKRMIFDWIKW